MENIWTKRAATWVDAVAASTDGVEAADVGVVKDQQPVLVADELSSQPGREGAQRTCENKYATERDHSDGMRKWRHDDSTPSWAL